MSSVPRRFRGSLASLLGPSHKPPESEKPAPLDSSGTPALRADPAPTADGVVRKTENLERKDVEERR
jgi:hypothetical protein